MSFEAELAGLVNKMVMDSFRDNLGDYLKEQIFGWHSTLLKPLLQSAVAKLKPLTVVQEAMEEVISEPAFKEQLKVGLRNRLANELVKSFPLTDVVKDLKNNPEAKAKISAVLEELIRS